MSTTQLNKIETRNEFIKFNDSSAMNKWHCYTTDWPEKDALHLMFFTYGICATVEHFNTDESGKEPKYRCLNKRFYNKWIADVVVRQESGPHLQVVPFEQSLCDSMELAISICEQYIAEHQENAMRNQTIHMATFKTKDLT